MSKRKKDGVKISFTVPERVKEEVLAQVKGGEYKSISDFVRKAVYSLLDEKSGDVLKERSLRRFIEELS